MKTIYLTPQVEVIPVYTAMLMQQVSGAGFNDGGQDDGSHAAQAPSRILF